MTGSHRHAVVPQSGMGPRYLLHFRCTGGGLRPLFNGQAPGKGDTDYQQRGNGVDVAFREDLRGQRYLGQKPIRRPDLCRQREGENASLCLQSEEIRQSVQYVMPPLVVHSNCRLRAGHLKGGTFAGSFVHGRLQRSCIDNNVPRAWTSRDNGKLVIGCVGSTALPTACWRFKPELIKRIANTGCIGGEDNVVAYGHLIGKT